MELAIPLIALGGLYVVSNQKKKEGFAGVPRQKALSSAPSYKALAGKSNINLPNTDVENYNYPISEKVTYSNDTQYYPNPNQSTDKYFQQVNYEDGAPQGVNSPVENLLTDMAGRDVNIKDYVSDNMIPFFGKQKSIGGTFQDRGQNSQMLDQMVGTGSLQQSKQEVAPLFKPEDNIQWAHGAPNESDFYQSRVNPSLQANNVKPFQEQNVGPGLDSGYTTQGSGGFNSGMEARNQWLPKTVNELRTSTNPKVTYGLQGHEGPAEGLVQNLGIHGKVEKHTPDGYYINSPDRYLTTTGIEKGQTLRGIEPNRHVNRATTTQSYTGMAGKGAGAEEATKRGVYRKDHKIQLGAEEVTPAHGLVEQNNLQSVKGGYNVLANNRTVNKQVHAFGAAHGLVAALTAPFSDLLRPSRKENTIGNGRPSGNPGSLVPENPTFNPADRAPTTTRETTTYSPFSRGQRAHDSTSDGGYKVSAHQPTANQRDSTNVYYGGSAMSVSPEPSSYAADYNATTTTSREKADRTNPGGTQMFNNYINQQSNAVKSTTHTSYTGSPKGVNTGTPNLAAQGNVYMPQSYEQQGTTRIDPNLLQAFKDNPYTHSLNSSV